MSTELHNDGGPIVVCCTCGAVVTQKISQERKWGTIRDFAGLVTSARLPQCSRACALVLYSEAYVDVRLQPQKVKP